MRSNHSIQIQFQNFCHVGFRVCQMISRSQLCTMKNFQKIKSQASPAAVRFLQFLLCISIFSACQSTEKKYAALPENTAILLEINGLKNLDSLFSKNKQPLAEAISGLSFFKKMRHDVEILEKIFPEKTDLGAKIFNQNAVAGLTLNQADQQKAVFIFEIGGKIDLAAALKNSPAKPKILPTNFKGKEIFAVQIIENQRLAFAEQSGLLIFSTQPYLVEDALAALESGKNMWADARFQKLADGKNEISTASLIFNFEKISNQISPDFLPDFRNLLPCLAENLPFLKLDFSEKKTTAQAFETGNFCKKKSWGASKREAVFSVLPENTAAFFWAGFENHRPFLDNFRMGKSADFQHFTTSWMGEELVVALTEPFSSDLREEQFYLLAVRDSMLCERRIAEFAERFGTLKNYEYQTFQIRQFFSPALLEPLLRDDALGFEKPACAMLAGYLVFASTTAALEVLIDKFIVNQILAASTDFLQLKNQFADAGQCLIFFHPKYLPAICERIFKNEHKKPAIENAKSMAAAGLLAFDFSGENLKIFAQKTADFLPQTGMLWKTELGAAAATQPFPATGAGSEKLAGIFIQDARNQLYFLLPNGEILWKRYLDGRMLGAPQSMDFSQNGTTCFLLNTPQKIYLFDENGNDVEGFPIDLKSPATNAVSLATFSKSGDCAFFLCCKNGNGYGFDRHGRPLPGWNPQANVGEVRQPILHFQHENKDFLVVLSRAGRLAVFGRSGDLRFPVQKFEGNFSAPPQADFSSNSPRIVASNDVSTGSTTGGKVFACNLSGQVFSLAAGGKSFVFSQISGDERKEYVSLTGDNLRVHGYQKDKFEVVFSKKYPVPQDTIFEIKMLRPAGLIGSWSREKRQVFLVNGRGNLLPDFPLGGTTPFSVVSPQARGDRNVWALVVALDSQVYAYSIR